MKEKKQYSYYCAAGQAYLDFRKEQKENNEPQNGFKEIWDVDTYSDFSIAEAIFNTTLRKGKHLTTVEPI
jgi:hypothetical protein